MIEYQGNNSNYSISSSREHSPNRSNVQEGSYQNVTTHPVISCVRSKINALHSQHAWTCNMDLCSLCTLICFFNTFIITTNNAWKFPSFKYVGHTRLLIKFIILIYRPFHFENAYRDRKSIRNKLHIYFFQDFWSDILGWTVMTVDSAWNPEGASLNE